MAEFRLAALLAVGCLVLLRAVGMLDFARLEMPSTARRVIALAALFVVLTISIFYPVATFGEAQNIDIETLQFRSRFAGHLLLVGFLVAWWVVAGRPPWRDYLSLPQAPVAPAIWSGIAVGAGGWAVTLLLTAIVAMTVSTVSEASLGPREVPPMMFWLAHLPIWRKLVIVAVAMTVEEAFFRAFLQRRLGLGISTALFALAHFNYGLPLLVVAVFTISLVFGALFEVRRNLLPCMVAHGVFDAIQIFVIIPLALSQVTGST